jgi:Arc/MetJ-type ribon-helix-helix transcriptional regulator
MARAGETEKITINLGPVDLGQIDLLVREGFYSNRTDFIRTAIRNQLGAHAEEVRRTVARQTLVLGVQHFTREDLEAVRDAGERLQIKVLGLASIADDVSPELALATIESVVVLGAFRASSAVKRALADRISGNLQSSTRKGGLQYAGHPEGDGRARRGDARRDGRGNAAHPRRPAGRAHGPHPASARRRDLSRRSGGF